MLVSTALELFACTKQNDGVWTLNADPSLVCFESWWWVLFGPAVAALVVYGLGIPLGVGLWLRWRVADIAEPGFAERYGSLYGNYVAEHPYWESVVMAEKALIAVVAVLFSGFVSLQLAVLGIVFTASLLVHAERKPLIRREDNNLQATLRWCSILILTAAQAFHSGDFPSDAVRTLIEYATVAVIVLALAIVFVRVVVDVATIYRESKVAISPHVMELASAMFSPQGVSRVVAWLRALGRDSAVFQARMVRGLQAVHAASMDHRHATRRRSTRSRSAKLPRGDDDGGDTPREGKRDYGPDPEQDALVETFFGGVWQSRMVPFVREWLKEAAAAVPAQHDGIIESSGDKCHRGKGRGEMLCLLSSFSSFARRCRRREHGDGAAGGGPDSDGQGELNVLARVLYGPVLPADAQVAWLRDAHFVGTLQDMIEAVPDDALGIWTEAVPEVRLTSGKHASSPEEPDRVVAAATGADVEIEMVELATPLAGELSEELPPPPPPPPGDEQGTIFL
jgi:hypothetical protein